MTDTNLTQLKVLVERIVRPVRASLRTKRKVREELLVHVSGVFEEEFARLGDDRGALAQTTVRLGDPAEVTAQLQKSVSAGDDFRRYWEGEPGEPAWRTAARVAGGTAALAAVVLGIMLAATGGTRGWPLAALLAGVGAALAVPAYFFALTLFTAWMERVCHGPLGWSWRRVVVAAAGLWLFTLLCMAGANRPAWQSRIPVTEAMTAGLISAHFVVFACALGTSSTKRAIYQREWAGLDIA